MDASQYSESLGKLGTRYLAAYTRNMERYAKFALGVLQAGPGMPSADTVQQRYADFLREEGPKFLGQLAQAGLNYYALLVNSGIEATNRFVDQVLQAPDVRPAPAAQPAVPPAILFRGRPGERPSNAFVVANNREQPIEVSFEVPEVVSEDGVMRFRPSVEFAPQTCRLAPHAEQVIQCSLLLSEQFRPGVMHRGQIRVVGFPEMSMRMSVEVEGSPEAPAAGEQASAKPQPKGTGKKPRAAR